MENITRSPRAPDPQLSVGDLDRIAGIACALCTFVEALGEALGESVRPDLLHPGSARPLNALEYVHIELTDLWVEALAKAMAQVAPERRDLQRGPGRSRPRRQPGTRR